MGDGRDVELVFYSNERVYLLGDAHFGANTAFTDFGAALCAAFPGRAVLAAPTRRLDRDEAAAMSLTPLPVDGDAFLALPFVQNRYQSGFQSLRSARQLLREVGARRAKALILAVPSTNAFGFWLSLLAPKQCRFAYFMRGDTVATLGAMFRGRALGRLVVAAARAMRRRELRLFRVGRAQVFPYGPVLARQFAGERGAVVPVAPILDPEWLIQPLAREQSGRCRLLYCGRLSAEKNLRMLVAVMGELVAAGMDLGLTIIGEGPERGRIEAAITEHGLGDRVEMRGHMAFGADYIAAFDAHDILCLCSSTEGTPRVVAEAMARGLCVVATPAGSVPEMAPGLIHVAAGFGAAEFRAALEGVVRDCAALQARAMAAREVAREFTVPVQAERVVAHLCGAGR